MAKMADVVFLSPACIDVSRSTSDGDYPANLVGFALGLIVPSLP